MADVTFHFGVPDRLAYACRLLRKARRAGARVAVTADAGTLDRLDGLLWTFEALEFLPHWRGESEAALPPRMKATPILLLDRVEPGSCCDVLVTLGDEPPLAFDAFGRVIEIVSTDADERARARQRWRQYAQAGSRVLAHEVAA